MTEKKKNQEIMHSHHEIPSRSRRRFMYGLIGTAAAASFSRFDKIAWTSKPSGRLPPEWVLLSNRNFSG